MMYSNRQRFSSRSDRGFSYTRRILAGVFLFISLTLTILLYFLALPALQIRLGGVQTNALARIAATCSDDDDSSVTYTFTYIFTGPQGKQYQITHDGFCTNVISDGDHVTVWYMPDNPTNMLATPEAILLYIMSGLGGAGDIACLVVFFVLLIKGLQANRRRETFNYANMRPY